MYTYIHVYIYICVYTYIHLYIRIYIHTCNKLIYTYTLSDEGDFVGDMTHLFVQRDSFIYATRRIHTAAAPSARAFES